ncbi:MAG: DnaJ domain-containing protein [Acidimicrobiales bacterium]
MAFAGRREGFSGRPDSTDEPTTPGRDPFVVLGVPPTASRKEITEAYRALAQIYHPDRHLEDSVRRRRRAERRMRELNEAYRVARTRPTVATYRGTNTVPSAALWLGTAPGTWARTARRSGSGAPVTEEERRLSVEQIAQAASEHDARTRVMREIRLQAHQQAGGGHARSQPKGRAGHGPRQTRVLAGMAQALATGEMRCMGCRSLQRLPGGWQQHLDDTDYACSACNRILLAR